MKTVVTLMLEKFNELQESNVPNQAHLFGMWFFYNAESLLEKEYETGVDALFHFAEFANNFLEPHIPPFTKDHIEQFYNATFNTKER